MTGRITRVYSDWGSGIITYQSPSMTDETIFFVGRSYKIKGLHSPWRIGDIVLSDIEKSEDDRDIAIVTDFIENELYTNLIMHTEENPNGVMQGYLKLIHNKLYFKEVSTKIKFRVKTLTPEDICIDESKIYEAYLVEGKNTYIVRLVEAENVANMAKQLKANLTPILATIQDVHPRYLIISIPDSDLLGKVVTFDANHGYKPGDTIRVYWKSNNKNKLNYIEEKYYVHDVYSNLMK